jgi:hypothetical protein
VETASNGESEFCAPSSAAGGAQCARALLLVELPTSSSSCKAGFPMSSLPPQIQEQQIEDGARTASRRVSSPTGEAGGPPHLRARPSIPLFPSAPLCLSACQSSDGDGRISRDHDVVAPPVAGDAGTTTATSSWQLLPFFPSFPT